MNGMYLLALCRVQLGPFANSKTSSFHLEEREFLEKLSNCKDFNKILHHVLGFLWLKMSVVHDFSFGGRRLVVNCMLK
jgi:hypothetical protein